jgi:KDO2-lipid IV(A) lauroyltransferase
MAKPPKTPWRRIRAKLEFLPISLGLMTIPYLSRKQLLRFAKIMGSLAALLDRRGRRIAIANIDYVFPNLSPKRKRLILLGCYRNISRVLFDMFWFGRDSLERVKTWVDLAPEWRAVLDRPEPKIIVTAHHGNWEMAGHAVVAGGYPLTSVGKPLGSKETTEKLNAFRSRLGQKIVSSEGAFIPLLRALKNGGNVALLADQYLNLAKGGIWTTFLGHPALTAPTPAFFAGRIKKGFIPVGYMQARPNGHYRCVTPIVLETIEGESMESLTQRVSDASSKMIKRFPTQWLFAYKRWRAIPEGADPKDFPFYANRAKRKP